MNIILDKFKIMNFPKNSGWYWVWIIGIESPIPCWYSIDTDYFLPAGLGDSSSQGIFSNEIEQLGPEIQEPVK